MYKAFSQDLYDKYNDVVLLHIVDNLKLDSKYVLVKNPDQYDIDLIIMCGEQPVGYIEGENHGKYWRGKDGFPFKTAHFLGRKTKYITDKAYYVLVSGGGESAVMIPFEKLNNYRLIPISNNSVENEMMYDVPIDKCVVGWSSIREYIESDLEEKKSVQKTLWENVK